MNLLRFSKKCGLQPRRIARRWCILLLSLTLLSCNSRNAEKGPSDYQESQSDRQRNQAQDILSKRLADVSLELDRDNDLFKIQDLLTEIQSMSNSSDLKSTSLLGAISQVNSSVVGRIVSLKDQGVSVSGNIDTSSLGTKCGRIRYQLTSDNLTPIQELHYFLSACASDQMLDVADVHFEGSAIKIEIQMTNIMAIFAISVPKMNLGKCTLSFTGTDASSCSDIMIGATGKIAWFMNIQKSTRSQITVRGLSKATGHAIYTDIVAIGPDGKIVDVDFSGPDSDSAEANDEKP